MEPFGVPVQDLIGIDEIDAGKPLFHATDKYAPLIILRHVRDAAALDPGVIDQPPGYNQGHAGRD
jgi:hypothetical protein